MKSPPDELMRLARVVRMALGGTMETGEPIDGALAELAIRRHDVGPLLYAAAKTTLRETDPAMLAVLAGCYGENATKQDAARALLAHVAEAFNESGIEWRVLKGWPQAALLYPDPALRIVSGIDILVRPGASAIAARILRRRGWAMAHISSPSPLSLARAGLRREPQLSLLDRATQQRIALHETLFFSDVALARIFGRDPSFCPRLPRNSSDLPGVGLGSALALGVLLRGGYKHWSSLKWLVDLAAVLCKLDVESEASLIEAIGEAKILPSAVASLLVFRTFFEGHLPDVLADWLDRQAVSPEIAIRRDRHFEALAAPQMVNSRLLPSRSVKIVPWPIQASRQTLERARRSSAYGFLRSLYRSFRPAGRRAHSVRQYQIATATREDRYPMAFSFARDQLAGGKPLQILSFGCSTGEEVFTLRSYFPHTRIKGIEIDVKRAAMCAARLAQTPDEAISFETAEATAHEPSESYDAIFCMAVLRDARLDTLQTNPGDGALTFGDFERAVSDFARCLKPGGLLFITHTNFRFCDTGVAAHFDVVLHADPPRSGLSPGLFDRADRRMEGAIYRSVGFRKKSSAVMPSVSG